MTIAALGAVALAVLVALLGRALVRMRPVWPYLGLALAVIATDLAFRHAVHAGVHVPGLALSEEHNPAGEDLGDLGWPNRLMAFGVTALAVWLTFRPQRRSPPVGAGLALTVTGGMVNLAEPLLRGYTTDYIVAGDFVLNVADVALVLGVPLAVAGVVQAEWSQARRRNPPLT